MAFGTAGFPPTGRNEHYASPAGRMRRLFERAAGPRRFAHVDEWNTSRICHRCLGPLQSIRYVAREVDPVTRKETSCGIREIRGLKRCPIINDDDYDDEAPAASSSSSGAAETGCTGQGITDDLHTSSEEEEKKKKKKSKCPLAGAFLDRDYNAARNMVTRYVNINLEGTALHRGNRVDTKRRIRKLHLKSNDRFIVKENNNKAKKKYRTVKQL